MVSPSRFPKKWILVCLLAAVASGSGWAGGPPPMPFEVHERLWEDPGPVQSAPQAPRLLLVYPTPEQTVHGSTLRYAGRVEPAEARVTLNGRALEVWPGGLIAGIAPVDPEGPRIWRFEASSPGGRTVVERTVRPVPVPEPTRHAPLELYRNPTWPTGPYFMRSGGPGLEVALYASAGRFAEVRAGEDGPWIPMEEAEPDPERGGVYRARIQPPPESRPDRPVAVQFRVSTGPERLKSLIYRSNLSMARLSARGSCLGVIEDDFAPFLKNPHEWDRLGNWSRATPFPVAEQRGQRLRVVFPEGTEGWIATGQASVQWRSPPPPPIHLPHPELEVTDGQLTVTWRGVQHPLPVTAEGARRSDRTCLRIALPGVGRVVPVDRKLSSGTPFESVRVAAPAGSAPFVEVVLSRPLHGYALRHEPGNKLCLRVRARRRAPRATPTQPLKGLRVMISAGHGGADPGALGASGLTEADLNLVQAAWLGRLLQGQGALVRQVRRTDVAVELDERVREAWRWDPHVFISLHHNAVALGRDPTDASGPQVYYHYDHSRPLAEAIGTRMTALLRPDRPPDIRRRNFRVTCNISLCPSVLVETGYLSHPGDEQQLRRTSSVRATAHAIAEGLTRYWMASDQAGRLKRELVD